MIAIVTVFCIFSITVILIFVGEIMSQKLHLGKKLQLVTDVPVNNPVFSVDNTTIATVANNEVLPVNVGNVTLTLNGTVTINGVEMAIMPATLEIEVVSPEVELTATEV